MNKIILTVLILLVLVEIIPYIITILFPDICYGCTPMGKVVQNLNSRIGFSYINWYIYTFLIIYFTSCSFTLKNKQLTLFIVLLCILLIYLPVWPLLNTFSLFLGLCYTNPPFIEKYQSVFPASVDIEKNATDIINEYNNYPIKPDCIRKTNPGFGIEKTDSDTNCWRAIYLKKLGIMETSMKEWFPITMGLLTDPQIHNAFFSILDPEVEIPPHVGYYKGFLRYHLGVVIPNTDSSDLSEKPYITCGGQTYYWKQGQGVMFDDMYLHNVKNPSNKTRVVLYLDIKRISPNKIINLINDVGISLVENSFVLNAFVKNQHQQNKL